MEGRIVKVSGPLIVAEGMEMCQMYDVVRVSESKLIGEIIELRGDKASIQVYEETSGLGPGEPVYATGSQLSVELAPGLIESIFDGIQRPLDKIRDAEGDRVTRGVSINALDHDKKWAFVPTAKVGEDVSAGDFLGYVQETTLVKHYIMVPNGISGKIEWLANSEATITEPVARIKTASGETAEVQMLQRWPVRSGIKRPISELAPQQYQFQHTVLLFQ